MSSNMYAEQECLIRQILKAIQLNVHYMVAKELN